jgi:hypothetical protein
LASVVARFSFRSLRVSTSYTVSSIRVSSFSFSSLNLLEKSSLLSV